VALLSLTSEQLFKIQQLALQEGLESDARRVLMEHRVEGIPLASLRYTPRLIHCSYLRCENAHVMIPTFVTNVPRPIVPFRKWLSNRVDLASL
jgi:hypothetical protein